MIEKHGGVAWPLCEQSDVKVFAWVGNGVGAISRKSGRALMSGIVFVQVVPLRASIGPAAHGTDSSDAET